jgi:hypothetical protein
MQHLLGRWKYCILFVYPKKQYFVERIKAPTSGPLFVG